MILIQTSDKVFHIQQISAHTTQITVQDKDTEQWKPALLEIKSETPFVDALQQMMKWAYSN